MAARAMWAPWRMAYIRGPKESRCIFCAYPAEGAAHARENLILCSRPQAFVMLNRYPFAAGHSMVVPRRHVADPAELSKAENAALFELVRESATLLRAACGADGCNIGMNLGAAAGAGIADHVHVHIVPRWRGDLNFMPTIADVRVMPEALAATYDRLAPAFAGARTRRRARGTRP